jgi:hypothetical protein
MAVHAGFRGRNAGRRRTLYSGVAKAAIDTVIACVVFVAELNRLITYNVLIRQIRGARRQKDAGQRQTRQKSRRKDTETGDEIRAAVKNLRHVYLCTLEVSAPGGSGNLGVHQNLSGMCKPESKFDAMSFQQNFLECNCSTLFSLLFYKVMPIERGSLFELYESPEHFAPARAKLILSPSEFEKIVLFWSGFFSLLRNRAFGGPS